MAQNIVCLGINMKDNLIFPLINMWSIYFKLCHLNVACKGSLRDVELF